MTRFLSFVISLLLFLKTTSGSMTCGQTGSTDSSKKILVVETCSACRRERCEAGTENMEEQRHCIWSHSRDACVPALGRTRRGDLPSHH